MHFLTHADALFMTAPATPSHTPRPLIDALVSVVLPSLILMKLSTPERLGTDGALVLALAFPLGWGLFELLRYRQFNFIAVLGVLSTLLTGGIGLLQLDTQWLAIKEAAIPGVIGVVVLASTYTRNPLIHRIIYNRTLFNVDRIQLYLEEKGHTQRFNTRLLRATYWLSGTFFFSSAMNYILARWLVSSPAGSEAFNGELAKMNMLSYPMIAVPSLLMMIGILYYLWRSIRELTGLTLEEMMVNQSPNKD